MRNPLSVRVRSVFRGAMFQPSQNTQTQYEVFKQYHIHTITSSQTTAPSDETSQHRYISPRGEAQVKCTNPLAAHCVQCLVVCLNGD